MSYGVGHLITPLRSRPIAAAVVAIAMSAAPAARAQQADAAQDRGWNTSLSISDTEQSDADLDTGGELGVSRAALALSARRQLESGLGLGVGVRLSRERWDFSDPLAFGGTAPWKDIRRAGVSVLLRGRLDERWQWLVAPTVQYAGEEGAKSSDAMSYGAAFGFSRRYGADLDLTFGVAALRDIDKNRLRPYVAVNWKIDERWRIGSPEAATPTGLGGIELAYRRNPAWDFGVGLGVSEYRFRLDRDGPTAGGVGESRSLPLYGRVSFRPNASIRLDAYAGSSFNNRVRLEYGGGRRISEEYDAAPLFGLAVSVSP